MKKTLTILFVMLFSAGLFAQQNTEEEQQEEKRKLDPTSLIISAGFVPSAEYRAAKFGLSVNNLVNRFGAYTSFEVGTGNDYFFNIYGITATVHRNVFLWGGIDLFTKYGLFNKGLNCRKEIGVGIIPHQNVVLMPGWSYTVGFTLQAGFRLPLMKVNP